MDESGILSIAKTVLNSTELIAAGANIIGNCSDISHGRLFISGKACITSAICGLAGEGGALGLEHRERLSGHVSRVANFRELVISIY